MSPAAVARVSRRLRRAACALAVLGLASTLPALPANAAGGGGYRPPYAAGPHGGDRYNVVKEDPRQGRVTIVRAYPEPGAFNCAGDGGYGTLVVSPTAGAPVSSVTVAYDTAVLDSYTWIIVLVRDTSGRWLGGGQRRGPVAGSGALTVPLPGTVAAGTHISVEFGLQVASACPNVDGGTVRFTSVSLRGAGAGRPAPTSPGSRLHHAVRGPSGVVTTVAFEFVPGDTDLHRAQLEVVEGMGLIYVGGDAAAPHTVTADAVGRDGNPLFDSGAPVGFGGAADVAGVARLAPGRYSFHCAVHTQMAGVLRVLEPAAATVTL